MKLLLMTVMAFLMFGCTKSSTSSLTPIQAAGCDVESLVTSGFASAVASALTCTNTTQIQTDLQTAFGNANLCQGQVAAATMAQLKAKGVSKGIVGSIACPIAINTAVGYLSNSIPTTWGCSAAATAASLSATLTTLCEGAVTI